MFQFVAVSMVLGAMLLLVLFLAERNQLTIDAGTVWQSSASVSAADARIPIKVEKQLVTKNYFDHIDAGRPMQICFLVGPAGAGKSSIVQRLAAEVRERVGKPGMSSGCLVVSLREQAVVPQDKQNRTTGTLDGLPEIPSLNGETNESLAYWLASITAKDMKEKGVAQLLSRIRREDVQYAIRQDAAGRWIDNARHSRSGIVVILDDLDEIGPRTFESVMRMITKEAVEGMSRSGRETVVLSGRTEIAIFASHWVTRLMNIAGAVNNDTLSVRTVTVEPIDYSTPGFAQYIDGILWRYEREASSKPNVEVVRKTLMQWLSNRSADYDPVRESIRYALGARITCEIVSDWAAVGRAFDPISFRSEFFDAWWTKTTLKHGLPPLRKAEELRTRIRVLVKGILDSRTTAPYSSSVQELLLSGLILLEPADVAAGRYLLKLQFPFLKDEI
jgi:hypothetical protein